MLQRKVLVLFAHPAFEKSRVNRRLVEEVRALPGVTFHDLYESYPDLDIDVPREQELLAGHDAVVMQHPFYWYSTPAMLKEWQDLVLEHGWAFGHEGTALHGKLWMNATTAGGGEQSYSHEGSNHCEIRELLLPLERTAQLCGMTYLPPFVVFGTHSIDDAGIRRHAADYRRVLEALRDDTLDLEAASAAASIQRNIDALIRKPAGA